MTRRRVGDAAPRLPGDLQQPFQRLHAELEEFRDMLADASYDRDGALAGGTNENDYWFSADGDAAADTDGMSS